MDIVSKDHKQITGCLDGKEFVVNFVDGVAKNVEKAVGEFLLLLNSADRAEEKANDEKKKPAKGKKAADVSAEPEQEAVTAPEVSEDPDVEESEKGGGE